MSLVSNLFLLFVAASVLVYYIVPQKCQWLVLLCFSYIYYLAGGVKYVGFLLFSTLVTWLVALGVEKMKAKGSQKNARNLLILGLVLNFGMLGVVKYTNFFVENLNALFHMNLRGMEILLPLGISFYTFQSSGYLLDVYWKRCDAEKNPVKYALFVSFSHRFCRDRSADTAVWPISSMSRINSRGKILPEVSNEFCGDSLRR